MLVYGDGERLERVADKRAAILDRLARAERMPPGIERHATVVTAFIAVGELVQGLADAAFEATGLDTRSGEEEVGMAALLALAGTVAASWRSGFQAGGPPPWPALAALGRLDGRQTIRTREAEGYAFYALYPEAYCEAARRSGLPPDTVVIGIRSIGTGLAALVAATIGAQAPITLRPSGHPFDRTVRIAPQLAAELTHRADGRFAVVDEGPGLSGSSFGAVADWLEAHGVARERIHFFPSHPGDLGPQASDRHRVRWAGAPRHWVSADELLRGPDARLESWIADLVGPLDAPLEDLSGGAWRGRRYGTEAAWPAANIQQERRKFLARAGGSTWLVKFAGLGAIGEAKLSRGRRLHGAGWTPEIAGLRYGFLVERWIEAAPSLDQVPVARSVLLDNLGAYLAFRAGAFPALSGRGASLPDLAAMARHNAGEALGAAASAALAQRLSRARELEGRVRRVETDNRLHPHEWLVARDRLIKADALDHSGAHDLVGCQDIAWDVAGAAVEFDLSEPETEELCERIERACGQGVDRDLLAFLLPCYLAFQLGACMLAARAIGGEEAARLLAAARRYERRLRSARGPLPA